MIKIEGEDWSSNGRAAQGKRSVTQRSLQRPAQPARPARASRTAYTNADSATNTAVMTSQRAR